MAAAAQNAVAAAINPGPWTKILDNPDQALISFERYIRIFKRYLNVSGHKNLSVDQWWDLLIYVGGPDMEDLIVHNAKVQTEARPHQPMVNAV